MSRLSNLAIQRIWLEAGLVFVVGCFTLAVVLV